MSDEMKARSPLWRKVALLTAIFAILPAGIIAISLLGANEAMIKVVSREVRLAAVTDITTQFEATLASAERDLSKVALALSDAALDRTMRIPLARTIVGASEYLEHVAIYDASGAWIDTIWGRDVPQLKLPESLDAAELSSLTPREVRMTLLPDRRLSVLMAFSPDGQRATGHALTHLDTGRIQARLEALVGEKFGGDASALFMMDRSGVITMHAEAARRGEALEDGGMLAWLLPMAKIPGLATSGEYSGEREWLVTAEPMQRVPWLVVARVTQAQAYAPLERMKLLVLLALAVTVVLSCIGALLFARQLTRPISALVRQCAALSRREFDARVSIKTRDELSVLGHTLNEAARELAESEEEIRQQQLIRADLGRYLPREIVESIAERRDLSALEGTRRHITVLFADIVDFTPLCESQPPEVVVTILNEFFTIATEIIFRHGGVVDKFVGDCVMAFWGAPEPSEDHAERALMAAEDLISWMDIGNAGWRERFGVELEVAIGAHSGVGLVGNVGSQSRIAYTVVGDVVNLAARLESIARPGQILISEACAQQAGDLFEIARIGTKTFPGMDGEVALCEVRL